jgi:hypothetical protein
VNCKEPRKNNRYDFLVRLNAFEDPLTQTLSPRGEGFRLRPFTQGGASFRRSFSPWGEGQDEGVLQNVNRPENRSG